MCGRRGGCVLLPGWPSESWGGFANFGAAIVVCFGNAFQLEFPAAVPSHPSLAVYLRLPKNFHHCHLCIHKFTHPFKALLTQFSAHKYLRVLTLLSQVSAPKCPPPFLTRWASECPPPTIPVPGLSLRGSLRPHLRTKLCHTKPNCTTPNHIKPYQTKQNCKKLYQTVPHHISPNHSIPYFCHILESLLQTAHRRKMHSVRETTGVLGFSQHYTEV